jgi:uncharacterized protein (DUF934 family)
MTIGKKIDLPKIDMEVKKQAGKVVLFKLTGDDFPTLDQIKETQIPSSGKIILPLKVYLLHKDELKDRLNKGEIAIWVLSHEEIGSHLNELGDLNQFPLIAVHIDKFADGRIFSIATQLRINFKFKNELRALGDILMDQLYFLKRCGYTSYLIRSDRNANQALKSLSDFSEPYQGAFDIHEPVWRRKSRKS